MSRLIKPRTQPDGGEGFKGKEQLLALILERWNMPRAMNQVTAIKGAPGVDGMTTNQLK